jgi:uncharacterized protein (TIGR01777 family)
MRILLSGGHGLIGRALAAALTGDGDQVVRLVRGSAGPGGLDVAWDPAAGTLDRAALDQVGPIDAVVNLSGAGIGDRRWTPARRRLLLESRVRSTDLVASTAAGLDPRPTVLVNASAVGYYGDRGDEELTEASTRGTGFLAGVCRDWEEATGPAADAGIRVVPVRSGVVLSPAGGALARQLPLFRLGLGGRLGGGRQFLSWISLPDEVAVLRRALVDADLTGPVNAVAPGPVTNAEFTRILAELLHRPAVCTVPRAALAVALGGQLTDEALLASQRALPVRLMAVGHQFAHPELAQALREVLAG